MPTLGARPTFRDHQTYVAKLEQERGFAKQTAVEKCLLLGEEMGELFKAVRTIESMGVDHRSRLTSVEEELADLTIYLCSIANRYGIDLEQAFRDKEAVNCARTWH